MTTERLDQTMDALLVVDMQRAMLEGDPKMDMDVVVGRINDLMAFIREQGGHVVFIQHDGPPNDSFEPETDGWQLLNELHVMPQDQIVRKRLNDAFFETDLERLLQSLGVDRLLLCGWATDFCVDATLRTAVAKGYPVVALADAHTLSDRPHGSAHQMREYHHWKWKNLIAPCAVQVLTVSQFMLSPDARSLSDSD